MVDAMQRSEDARSMNGMAEAQQRRVRVLMETGRHRIEGFLTLPLGGYRSRVSDYLNAADRGQFLSLADATLEPLDGAPSEQHGFLAVSRSQIVFLLELDPTDAPQAPPGESSLASA